MISVAEVGYALTSLGEKLSEEEVDQMVGQYADMEGEGRFNKADFVARIKWQKIDICKYYVYFLTSLLPKILIYRPTNDFAPLV